MYSWDEWYKIENVLHKIVQKRQEEHEECVRQRGNDFKNQHQLPTFYALVKAKEDWSEWHDKCSDVCTIDT